MMAASRPPGDPVPRAFRQVATLAVALAAAHGVAACDSGAAAAGIPIGNLVWQVTGVRK